MQKPGALAGLSVFETMAGYPRMRWIFSSITFWGT